MVHQRAETSLKRAIEGYYRIGQLLAMPALLDQPKVRASALTVTRQPLRG